MVSGLAKNLNLPWVAVTGLAVWFLLVHTPTFWSNRQLWTRDSLLAIHILTASTIFAACIHNALFTPSVTVCRTSCQWAHTWVGRIGLLAGLVSFPTGAILAWSRLGMGGERGTELGFVIPITIGGIAQIITQYLGYKAIRKYKALGPIIDAKMQEILHSKIPSRHLEQEVQDLQAERHKALLNHIGNMIGLFALACAIPGGLRLAQVVTGRHDGVATLIVTLVIIGVLYWIMFRYMAVMSPSRLPRSTSSSNSGAVDDSSNAIAAMTPHNHIGHDYGSSA